MEKRNGKVVQNRGWKRHQYFNASCHCVWSLKLICECECVDMTSAPTILSITIEITNCKRISWKRQQDYFLKKVVEKKGPEIAFQPSIVLHYSTKKTKWKSWGCSLTKVTVVEKGTTLCCGKLVPIWCDVQVIDPTKDFWNVIRDQLPCKHKRPLNTILGQQWYRR